MPVVAKVLAPPNYVGLTATSVYSPSGVLAIIDKCTAHNVSGADAVLSIHLASPEAIALNENKVLFNRTIAPGQTYLCPEVVGHALRAGSNIFVSASVAGVISVRISGREIS
jgi:hypothetical protein